MGRIKKIIVPGKTPGAGSFNYDDIVVNSADGKLYIKNSRNQVIEVTATSIGGSTDTSSLLTTASVHNNLITFTKGDGSTFNILVDTGSSGGGGSPTPTGSLLTTASVSLNVLTFTKGDGSTFEVTIDTGSAPTPISTSSLLLTASVNLNQITFTKGDSSTFSITVDTGSAGGSVDTSSLLITASAVLNQVTFTKGDGSTFDVNIDTGSSVLSSSFAITSSYVEYENIANNRHLFPLQEYNRTTTIATTANGESMVVIPTLLDGWAIKEVMFSAYSNPGGAGSTVCSLLQNGVTIAASTSTLSSTTGYAGQTGIDIEVDEGDILSLKVSSVAATPGDGLSGTVVIGPWGGTATPALPILDQLSTSSFASYSMRLLTAGYAGSCIKVRNISGSNIDIGFVDGYLDKNALANHLSGSAGTISKWYDQSGNGWDVGNTDTSQQPTVTLGQFDGHSGSYVANFNGLKTLFSSTTGGSINQNDLDIYVVAYKDSSTYGTLYCATANINNFGSSYTALIQTSTQVRGYIGGVNNGANLSLTNEASWCRVYRSGSGTDNQLEVFKESDSSTTTKSKTNAATESNVSYIMMGAERENPVASAFSGDLLEVIHINGAILSSADSSLLENNQKSYYNYA